MLVASVGSGVALDLGLSTPALADGDQPSQSKRLDFGRLEALVDLMQGTSADQLLPLLVERWKAGSPLSDLVAAAALANARAFGGQDYEGYHAFMALAPAYQMSRELEGPAQVLPVLKVIYRNTSHIQQMGRSSHDAIQPLERPADSAVTRPPTAQELCDAAHRQDMMKAEQTFARLAQGSLDESYNDLQHLVQEYPNVHRVVLAWRAWALLDLTGKEHALTLLRQSVRYCVDEESNIRRSKNGDALRNLLPTLLDRHGLIARSPGNQRPDDAWIERMAQTVYGSERDQAAEAVAEALAEGIAPESIGEAIALAANQLVLRDPGRPKDESPEKPKGSIHGASVGVHASDAANAWRNIARVSNHRNALASLVVAAYHTAGQANGQLSQSSPNDSQREAVHGITAANLMDEADRAIRSNEQDRACALVHRAGDLGLDSRPVFDLLLKYAISEDGALHAEKYYRTVSEEFRSSREAFRWRHLAALARVTASEHGHPAPGIAEARDLIKKS
jgi:hypothetical protein